MQNQSLVETVVLRFGDSCFLQKTKLRDTHTSYQHQGAKLHKLNHMDTRVTVRSAVLVVNAVELTAQMSNGHWQGDCSVDPTRHTSTVKAA